MKAGILETDISLMGGVEITTVSLAKNMVSYGCETEIITCRNKRDFKLDSIPVKSIGAGESQRFLTDRNIKRICEIVRRDRCEIVVVQLNAPQKNCMLASYSLIKNMSKYADIYITLHNSPVSFITRYRLHGDSFAVYRMKKFYTNIRYKPWAVRFLKRSEKYVKKYLTLSIGCREELSDVYGIESDIQYNPYIWHFSETMVKKNIVLWAGRLSREKNIYLLLRAWSGLDTADWKLKIAGDGEEFQNADAFIRKNHMQNAELLGEMPHHDLCRLMEESSIFVLTSFHEGFPTVITEAMNRKNAVVTTKFDGISDELLCKETAVITGFHVKEVRAALSKLMNQDKFLRNMQQNAYKRCKAYAAISQQKPVFL